MMILDANVLIYAVNSAAPNHDAAKRWLDNAAASGQVMGMSWAAMLAFVRLATKANVFDRPMSVDAAFDQLDAWLSQPNAVVVEPGPRHSEMMRSLLAEAGTGGNLVNDAHLAALALERRCDVVSFDSDFERFASVTWTRPK